MPILGIDLGTTNSACAIFQGDKVALIPNRYGEFLTPSVISVDDQQQLLVGKYAQQRLITHPNSSIAVFKRLMGTDHNIQLGKMTMTPPELSALVLKNLKEDAEKFLNDRVEEAVISVPAYFNDIQRKATKMAGELAGLKVERLINEPTAAAMAYGLHQKSEGNAFMVVDLGGGTFDVSIIEYFEGVLEVHASAGDNFLGGEDFLQNLLNFYLEKIGLNAAQLNLGQLSQLRSGLEKIKCRLSSENSIVIPPLLEDHPEIEISREDFFNINQSLLHKIQIPIERALRDAKLKPQELSNIVLVGGATRMPMLRSLIAKMFRRMPAAHLDPDLVVAMGAGIQAALKSQNQALEDIVLTDVSAYSLGVGILNENDVKGEMGLLFSPIIERNTVVPVSMVRTYSTISDNQTRINFNIYQGESRLVKNNILLGNIELQVPPAPKGKESVDVRFSYDMNGLLEIDVIVNSTGMRYQKTIENLPGQLTPEQIEASKKKLASLKFHPRDSEINRMLLARAEKLFEASLGDERDFLSQIIQKFESALETQNLRKIQQAQKDFQESLDRFDKDIWLS